MENPLEGEADMHMLQAITEGTQRTGGQVSRSQQRGDYSSDAEGKGNAGFQRVGPLLGRRQRSHIPRFQQILASHHEKHDGRPRVLGRCRCTRGARLPPKQALNLSATSCLESTMCGYLAHLRLNLV